MMNAAASLQAQLLAVNANLANRGFGDWRPAKQIADRIEKDHGEGREPASSAVLEALRGFWSSKKLPDYRTVKLVCYGLLTRLRTGGPCLMEAPELVAKVLRGAASLKNKARPFRRCFQGLLAAYFSLNPHVAPNHMSVKGWRLVRDFLQGNVGALRQAERRPDWTEAIVEHANLLGDSPCDRYGPAILDGDRRQFDSACERLGIASNSWVREQVVLSVIRSAARLPDAQFAQRIESLLGLLSNAKTLQSLGVGALLDRYANMTARPAHLALSRAADAAFGNPLLLVNASRWQHVSAAAKKMVGEWIAGHVMAKFFELLSHDGATDKRRVRFWSKYLPVIENIWLVLGKAASAEENADFKQLRKLMGHQALRLEGTTRNNNAFIMKIGAHYLIEFGETGNAAYRYPAAKLPFELAGALHLNELKCGRDKQAHRDTNECMWEDRFREEFNLPKLGGITPSNSSAPAVAPSSGVQISRPAVAPQASRPVPSAKSSSTSAPNSAASKPDPGHTQVGGGRPALSLVKSAPIDNAAAAGAYRSQNFECELKLFCAEGGMRLDDQRARGGSLIVYAAKDSAEVSSALSQWGFRYDAKQAFWILPK